MSIDITGIDKAQLLAGLYNRQRSSRWGMKTPFRLMEPEGPGCARNIILDADGQSVGSSFLPTNMGWESASAEAERLARLFCTAPELLEALTMVRDADADCVRDGLPRWCTDVARAKIDAAIAKAEGEA